MRTFIGRLFGARRSTPTRGARLGLEALDRRDLPSITWVPEGGFGGRIEITGDASNDIVYVSNQANIAHDPYDDQVVVTRYSGGYGPNGFSFVTEAAAFDRFANFSGLHLPRVSRVVATLNDGYNNFSNFTNVRSEATGGKDPDKFSGGSGPDTFDGKGGNDTLDGNAGRDTLYGGPGYDVIHGGPGNDGLYGGIGIDALYGDGGADRFLVHGAGWLTIGDETAADAVVHFNDGPATFAWGATWAAQDWTESDVRQIDAALGAMHDRLGNTTLLKTAAGGEQTFVRVGLPSPSSSVVSWNDSAGTITISQRAYDSGADLLNHAVFHEVGHNWDEVTENAFVWQFRAVSDWTILDSPNGQAKYNSGNYAKSGDEDWVYSLASQNEFASAYARTNPKEDFAESFTAYFMKYTGRTFQFGPGASAIPNKLAVIELFLDAHDTPAD